MLKRYLIGVGLVAVALALALPGAGTAYAEGEPPAAHAALTEYTGPETCAQCHMNAAQEVVESLHYQHQGEVPYREGWEEDVLGGMYVTY